MLVRALVVVMLLLPQAPSAREAIALGKTRDEALFASFNKGYALAASGPVESAEIITEFRREVLIVRGKAEQGELAITERDVATAMAPYRGRVEFIVQVRLHPLNVYVKAPAYDVYVRSGPRTGPIAAEKQTREPVFALGEGGGIIAVRLDATFPRAAIETAPSPLLVVNDDQGNIIWQALLDLSRFR